ncbi:MAG: aminopeptidase [Gammaproteobacteria bacterium]|nr:aminopeptidase [Gammaproteobacteria bacterium]
MAIAKRSSLVIKSLLVAVVLVGLVACETIGYYGQAAQGQLAILWNRERINDLLTEQELPAELRDKLTTVLQIREFATGELLLPAGDSYLSYVELDREHVVWNVFAAPEFSVDPVSWCYPIAGCVSYRGYFSEAGALSFADRLQQQGYDVYTGGVDAYSTLGWFDDPLLSTVIKRQDYQLATLIFHELAHQLVYVPGDTTFNESFATALEQEGLRRWLDWQGDSVTLERAQQETLRRQQFVDLVIDYREKFSELYQQELQETEKRLRKAELQELMRLAYRDLKQSWGGIGAYDRWFESSLNNAQLSTVSSYNELVPAFTKLLQEEGGDLEAFYTRIAELADMDAKDRDRLLTGEGSET